MRTPQLFELVPGLFDGHHADGTSSQASYQRPLGPVHGRDLDGVGGSARGGHRRFLSPPIAADG
ncbi:MAG: hypothetical protein OWU84_12000 [Firmicutes bacterium]|nr:hypothetical protein [Bacillota bacterium]